MLGGIFVPRSRYYQNNVWATENVAERCGSPAKCKLCERGPNQTAFSEWIPESYPGECIDCSSTRQGVRFDAHPLNCCCGL